MANFTALKTAINNAIKTNGNEEITGAILQAILDAMVETLGDSAITDLENAITTEVTNRENAVGGVADDLAAEVQARQALDYNVNNRINAEEYNRQNADAALSQTMSQGFQTLGSQMTALNAAISALNAAYQNGYLYGGIATPSSSPSNNKCFYIALQGGVYTNFGGVGVVEGINIIKNDSGWKVEHIYDQTTLLNEFYLLRQQVIQAITSFAPIVIEGDVTNAPDEEDLTSDAQHLLKFKDRAYSPLNFSGLGMKILRKNIAPLSDSAAFNGFVEGVTAEETLAGTPELIFWDRMNTRFVGIKDGIYYAAWTDDDNYVPVSTSLVYMYNGTPYQWTGSDFIVDETEVPNLVNCLTQDMINEANTIYIIRYDYTLKEDITIPANCVLKFDGGSLSNGIITGNDTGIQAGLVKIFNTNVTLNGIWNISEVYPDWFGIVYNTSSVDNAPSLEAAVNFSKYCVGKTIKLNDGVIYIRPLPEGCPDIITYHDTVPYCRDLNEYYYARIMLYDGCSFIMSSNTYLRVIQNSSVKYNVISIPNCSNVVIKGGNLVGDSENRTDTAEFGYGIMVYNGNNVRIEHINISYCKGDGIYLGTNNSTLPSGVTPETLSHNNNVTIQNVYLYHNARCGIAPLDGNNIVIKNVTIDSHYYSAALDFEADGLYARVHGAQVYNITFINNNTLPIQVYCYNHKNVYDEQGNVVEFCFKNIYISNINVINTQHNDHYDIKVSNTENIIIENSNIKGIYLCNIDKGNIRKNTIKNRVLITSSITPNPNTIIDVENNTIGEPSVDTTRIISYEGAKQINIINNIIHDVQAESTQLFNIDSNTNIVLQGNIFVNRLGVTSTNVPYYKTMNRAVCFGNSLPLISGTYKLDNNDTVPAPMPEPRYFRTLLYNNASVKLTIELDRTGILYLSLGTKALNYRKAERLSTFLVATTIDMIQDMHYFTNVANKIGGLRVVSQSEENNSIVVEICITGVIDSIYAIDITGCIYGTMNIKSVICEEITDNTELINADDLIPKFIPCYNYNQNAVVVNGRQYDGEVYDVRREGTYSQKPSNVKVGFKYFATDKGTAGVGAPIYYTGDSTTPWVYADGTAVS